MAESPGKATSVALAEQLRKNVNSSKEVGDEYCHWFVEKRADAG